jgi:translation initiation factor IF-3
LPPRPPGSTAPAAQSAPTAPTPTPAATAPAPAPRPYNSGPRPPYAGGGGSRPPYGGGSSRPPYSGGGGSRPNRDEEREQKDDGYRINGRIRSPEVRLIGADGEMIGVLSSREALFKAQEAGLDLVEISPNAAPPVCKIMDFGKFKFEEQKKKKEAKKKQVVIQIKEMKLRPQIDPHDLGIKIRQMKEFLAEGDKVKVSMRLRGREAAANAKLAKAVFQKIQDDCADVGKAESEPRSEMGGMIVMMMVPSK